MKNLVIFDIDGTLTNTVKIDDSLYLNTIRNLYSIDLSESTWSDYKQNSSGTDSGIFELFHKEYIPSKDFSSELNKFKSHFIHYLRLELIHNNGINNNDYGVNEFIRELKKESDLAIGIATGSWKYSGIIKLQASKIDLFPDLYSNADKFSKRTDIIYDVIEQAKIKYKKIEQVTYFGDGIWDKNSAEELGINFIGVDLEKNNLFKSLGVDIVVNDYKKPFELISILNNKKSSQQLWIPVYW